MVGKPAILPQRVCTCISKLDVVLIFIEKYKGISAITVASSFVDEADTTSLFNPKLHGGSA
jgi:hypothetical protein